MSLDEANADAHAAYEELAQYVQMSPRELQRELDELRIQRYCPRSAKAKSPGTKPQRRNDPKAIQRRIDAAERAQRIQRDEERMPPEPEIDFKAIAGG